MTVVTEKRVQVFIGKTPREGCDDFECGQFLLLVGSDYEQLITEDKGQTGAEGSLP